MCRQVNKQAINKNPLSKLKRIQAGEEEFIHESRQAVTKERSQWREVVAVQQ
jgi:hypothetical protein